MARHYTLANDCLSLLRNCDLSSLNKLSLEVQLYQLKRLLLSLELEPASAESCCSTLLEIRRQLDDLCNQREASAGFSDVSRGLAALVNTLANHPQAPPRR